MPVHKEFDTGESDSGSTGESDSGSTGESDSASEYIAVEQSDDNEELKDLPLEEGDKVAGNSDDDTDDADLHAEDDDALLREMRDQMREYRQCHDAGTLETNDDDDEQLFNSNLWTSEQYRQELQRLDHDIFNIKTYAKGTERTLRSVEAQWDGYVRSCFVAAAILLTPADFAMWFYAKTQRNRCFPSIWVLFMSSSAGS